MRKKVRLILLAASVVFLSGTAILYLAGVEDEQGDLALAIPDPVDCPLGDFCGRLVDYTGGCANRACCPQGSNYCNHYPSDVHVSFPRIVAASEGTCFRPGGQKEYCERWQCGGAVLCSEGTCVATGEPEHVMVTEWVNTTRPCPDRRY
jgi:hypothetical protein